MRRHLFIPLVLFVLFSALRLSSAEKLKILRAVFLDRTKVEITLDSLTQSQKFTPEDFYLNDENGRKIPIKSLVCSPGNKQLRLELDEKAEAFHLYRLISQYAEEIPLERNGMLDDQDYIYNGNDLGFTYSPLKTSFKVWTPVASEVRILLFKSPQGDEFATHVLARDAKGTWSVTIPGDLNNSYYLYEVIIDGKLKRTPDPYSTGLSMNSTRSLIFDLKATNPQGWDTQKRSDFRNMTDAVIYEVHVRDFSINKNSGIRNKGKYLAFTETGTRGPNGEKTGVDHLKELGVTHVHLLPVYDFGSVDESRSDQYNWGYDPMFYNVPEGSYATDPNGDTRIREFKRMVQGLHNNGLRVVMDVVYNHTHTIGSSAFDVLVPGYYYRFDAEGRYSDASGCGNEIATEKPMVRSFILNSLKYWMKEYKIDGFRFDLLGAFDVETARQIVNELRAADPSVLLYGEPWAPGRSPMPESMRVIKGNQKNLGLAVFNDNIRDAIKGDTQGTRPGFVQGVLSDKEAVKRGIEGSINDFTAQPTETINYVASHDDLCLWDKLIKTSPGSSESEIMKMSMLSNGIIFTSQGISFLHGGEDFARTKKGNPNTFQAGDEFNQFIYSNKTKYRNLFRYYQGLIKLRRNHPAFRMTSAGMIRKNLSFFDSPEGTIGFMIKNNANNDTWSRITVLYNTNKTPVRITLPVQANWTVVVDDDEAGINPVRTGTSRVRSNSVELKPVSMMVMYSK